MYLTEKLADFVATVRYPDIPEQARRKAKECILDCIGVAVAGSVDPIAGPVMQYLKEMGGHGQSTIIGHGSKAPAAHAAFANGVIGHVLDYDDTNVIFVGHASVVIVPAIIALAEKLRATGEDIITAYMVGTEVQWRIGDALVAGGNDYEKGWHSTCTVGSFGAVAAAAKLLRLDARTTAHALGIAASEAAGFQEQFGTHCKALHAGRANENGVRATLLARGGFTSAKAALEGKVGYLNLVADRHDVARIDNFARPWGIIDPCYARGMALKKFPICGSGCGAVEGMQSLMQDHGIKPDDVHAIECGVYPMGLNVLKHHEPKTGLEAKFSVEFWMAITLLEGKLGLAQMTDEMVQRPDVIALMRKVRVAEDPSIELSACKVAIRVKMKGGKTYGTAYYPCKGAPENPLTEAELVAKFEECADWGRLPKQNARRAIELLLALNRLTDVDDVMRSVSRVAI